MNSMQAEIEKTEFVPEPEPFTPVRDLVSGKPNLLIQSRLGLQDIHEYRLFLCMLERAYDGIDLDKPFEIDIAHIIPCRGGGQYQALKTACQNVMARTVDLLPHEKKKFKLRHLVDMADFEESRGRGKLQVRFHPDVVPHIKAMFTKGHYTKIFLKYALPLRSTYSARIYELLLQFRPFGVRTISLSEFRFFLNIEDKFPQWINIKQRVLEPGQKHLAEYTDIAFSYSVQKQGKAVNSIKFSIRENNPSKLIEEEQARQTNLFAHTPLPLPHEDAEHVKIVREYIWADHQEQALQFSPGRITYYFRLAQTAQRIGKIKSDFKGYFYSSLFRDKDNYEQLQRMKARQIAKLKKESVSKQQEEREADEAFEKATIAFDVLSASEQNVFLAKTHPDLPTGIRRHTAIALFAGLT